MVIKNRDKPVTNCNVFPFFSDVSRYHTFLSDHQFMMKNQRKQYLGKLKTVSCDYLLFCPCGVKYHNYGSMLIAVRDHMMTWRFCSRPNLQTSIENNLLFPLILCNVKIVDLLLFFKKHNRTVDFRFFEPQEPSQKEIKPSRGRTVAVYSRK